MSAYDVIELKKTEKKRKQNRLTTVAHFKESAISNLSSCSNIKSNKSLEKTHNKKLITRKSLINILMPVSASTGINLYGVFCFLFY